MTFIEPIVRELGCCIANTIGSENIGLLAKQVIDKDGKSMFWRNEKQLLISDTSKYQGFHFHSGDATPVRRQENPFQHCSPALMANVPMTFLLFGFLGKNSSRIWKALECFQNRCYAYSENDVELISADVNYTKFNSNPAQIARKHFAGKWPGIVHAQFEISALEIQYNMKVSTCEYCFE